jgi:hypothetical protein
VLDRARRAVGPVRLKHSNCVATLCPPACVPSVEARHQHYDAESDSNIHGNLTSHSMFTGAREHPKAESRSFDLRSSVNSWVKPRESFIVFLSFFGFVPLRRRPRTIFLCNVRGV